MGMRNAAITPLSTGNQQLHETMRQMYVCDTALSVSNVHIHSSNVSFAFFIDPRCVCGDVAGSGVLWSGILPVVILSLGHNSNQGDEHHWQRETCHHCKGRVECASCMTESA